MQTVYEGSNFGLFEQHAKNEYGRWFFRLMLPNGKWGNWQRNQISQAEIKSHESWVINNFKTVLTVNVRLPSHGKTQTQNNC